MNGFPTLVHVYESYAFFYMGTRNYKWLPYHTVPARNDQRENVQKWREIIHNFMKIKMHRKDKTRNTVGKPFIIPCPRVSFSCLDKFPNRVINGSPYTNGNRQMKDGVYTPVWCNIMLSYVIWML